MKAYSLLTEKAASQWVIRSMKNSKQELDDFMKMLSDNDCYAEVYCVAFDAMKALKDALKTLPVALKEAQRQAKIVEPSKNHAKTFLRAQKKKVKK